MSTGTTVVTGGCGFLGSHLCLALLARGDTVICIDNLATGSMRNIEQLVGHERFLCFEHDIVTPFDRHPALHATFAEHVPDRICNLASPASPPVYQRLSIETLRVGSVGMTNVLDLAVATGARVLQASTSEVYGDPHVHPQPETYWGHVNPNGPRSMYDESKRFAEAMCAAYVARHGVELRTVRIFNTYGPRMSPEDGRVVSTFVRQALTGEPLTVFGDGLQTRSFCYVDDQVRGIVALLGSDLRGPVNIGNPGECTMLALAELVLELTGSHAPVVHRPLPGDDPLQRRPDITRARTELGWEPIVSLRDGLARTIAWFRDELRSA